MRFIKLFAGLALVALAQSSASSQRVPAESGRSVRGEILVKFKAGTSGSVRAAAHSQAGGRLQAESARTRVQLIRVKDGDESAALARYRRNPNVLYAEPNYIRMLPRPVSHDPGQQAVPSDYYFDEQYALHNTGQQFVCIEIFPGQDFCIYFGKPDADIDAPEAWAITKGNPAVKVAIIDSGVDYNHPDLAANYAGGYDFYSGDPDPMDELGHGTHVAGTIAAAMNNPTGDPAKEEGVVGVAPNVKILAYKACGSDGTCNDFAIQDAVARAVEDGAKVINMSLGSTDPSQALNEAIQDAWQAGLVIVAGAGNNGVNTPFYPAAFDNVISVGAFDEDHLRASFSNFGTNWVDISAPGNVIMSSVPLALCMGAPQVPGDTGCYDWKSGTSMSTPHVSGAAALVWSRSDITSNAQVVDAILQSADPQGVGTTRLDTWTTHGGLNIHDALSYAATNGAPVANAGGPYSGVAGQSVAFDGQASSDPNSDALVFAWDFGDGAQGSGATPTHTYAQPGTYTVVLTVDDQHGGTNSASTTATITAANRAPLAAVGGPYSGTSGQAVLFDGSGSSDPDSDTLVYSWDFGDGTQATGATPWHTYAQPGTYTVVLTVDDQHGSTNSGSTTATIAAPNRAPVAVAGGPYSGISGQSVSFDGGGSSDPDSDTLLYSWMFGDGTQATGATPTHTYAQPGTYSVVLTVDDQRGATHSATTTATITAPNRPPVANAGPDQTVTDANNNGSETVTLNGTASSDPDGDALTYTWREGTVVLASGASPTVSLAVGAHTLTLTVIDTRGLQSSDTVTINVQRPSDTVSVLKANYTSRTRELAVEATSSAAPAATLTVFDITNPSSPLQIGTLPYVAKKGRYIRTFVLPAKPTTIRVVSSAGGSATSAVGGR